MQINIIIYCVIIVYKFFKGDLKKTVQWFNTEIPYLANQKPADMIFCGRGRKLLRFIENAVEGNNP